MQFNGFSFRRINQEKKLEQIFLYLTDLYEMIFFLQFIHSLKSNATNFQT